MLFGPGTVCIFYTRRYLFHNKTRGRGLEANHTTVRVILLNISRSPILYLDLWNVHGISFLADLLTLRLDGVISPSPSPTPRFRSPNHTPTARVRCRHAAHHRPSSTFRVRCRQQRSNDRSTVIYKKNFFKLK